MNLKLQTIYNLIKPSWKVISDVGCDHAYLSWYSYQKNDDHIFYNLDNKQGPLQNGKKNQPNNKNAYFILSNGLDYFQDKKIHIDCCVIAGMGGLNIINILSNNHVYIKYFILQPDNNIEVFEEWIISNHYEFLDLKVIKEQNHTYWIYLIKNNNDIKSI